MLRNYDLKIYKQNANQGFFLPLTALRSLKIRSKKKHFSARSQNCEKRLLATSGLSVCPHETTRLPWTDYHKIDI